ncbi:MAG: 3-methyl-2-oxobutanoate hydroxymethyltransferase [Deltaproteobacteria bacterium]|jgi:3-methyl-2-oxobutanoate hydroxymethyltransferase|nr:3-methyl-2-oxobutanoate hydroxymethyltransferase [Deltaproteobacteria bacterium]
MRKTVSTFAAAKAKGEKLTMLTAYDYSFARLVDSAGVDSILVGDSLGNVILGYEDTISVTMEDIIHHTKAVARGAKSALVVADMPFMSYQVSVPQAVENAGRLLKEGRAQAVKLEGGVVVADQIRAIVNASIPVVGHIGLTPQSVNAMGGFKVQGKDEEQVRRLFEDGKAVEAAGAFAVVVECVPANVMKKLTELLTIPTIGIGAGPHCDGQVLVYHDMLGLFEGFAPRFVRRYAEAGDLIRLAFGRFVAEVKKGEFPGPEHCFDGPDVSIPKMY